MVLQTPALPMPCGRSRLLLLQRAWHVRLQNAGMSSSNPDQKLSHTACYARSCVGKGSDADVPATLTKSSARGWTSMGEGSHEGGSRLLDPQKAMREPLVSIIVVVFRDRAELTALIENLMPFRGDDLETILIDGGSNDGSLEVLQQRSGEIDYWKSERDTGIYDAMNKGLKAARGRWILHINAGDRLLTVPYSELRSLPDSTAIFCCRVQCSDLLFIPRTNWTSRFQNTWQHQGTFYRRAAHEGYDTSYRILGDCAANHRMIKQGKRSAMSREVVALHGPGGISDSQQIQSELVRSTRENFGYAHHLANLLLFRPAKKLYYWYDRMRRNRRLATP